MQGKLSYVVAYQAQARARVDCILFGVALGAGILLPGIGFAIGGIGFLYNLHVFR